MDNQEKFFSLLKELFEKFHRDFDVKTLSSCGSCYYCCSSLVKFPLLFSLEKDFIEKCIEENTIPVSLKEYQGFLEKRNLPVCPFYLDGSGCRIYNFRPLFCRIFGQAEYDSPMPETCIYKSAEGRRTHDHLKKFLREYNEFLMDYTRYKLSLSETEDERMELLLEQGRELVLLDRYQEARDTFSQIINIKEDEIVFYELAWTCVWTKCFEDAITYFTKALKAGIEKIHPSIYKDLAYSYMNLNQPEQSESFFDKAISLEPGNVMAHIGKYLVYEQKGLKIEAKKKLKQMLRLFPYDKEVQMFNKNQ